MSEQASGNRSSGEGRSEPLEAIDGAADRWNRDSVLTTAREGRGWPDRIAGFALLVVLAVVGGPLGALVGVVTLAAWLVLGTPYAIASGFVMLPAAFPDGIDPVSFGLVAASFLALVLAPALHTPEPARFAAVTLASALGLGGLAWALARDASLWLAGALLLSAIAIPAYGLHRYELVRLGLVTDDVTTTDDTTSEEL